MLLLDQQSCYDRVLIPSVINAAYFAGTCDDGLLYLDGRLTHRHTYLEWEGEVLGPIRDTLGVEQGGVASDRLFHLTNNELLSLLQSPGIGVDMGTCVEDNGTLLHQVLAAVGLALNLNWSFIAFVVQLIMLTS